MLASAFALLILTASTCGASKWTNPDLPDDFPGLGLQVVGFIGTVTNFITPVYGISSGKDPISLVHVKVERYLTGSWQPTEFVSLAAVYFNREYGEMAFIQGTTPPFVFLKPGMRIIALAARRPPEKTVGKNIETFGGRFWLSYVREIHTQQDASGKTSNRLDRVRLGSYSFMNGKAKLPETGHVPAEQLILDRQPESLTLEDVLRLIDKGYNHKENAEEKDK